MERAYIYDEIDTVRAQQVFPATNNDPDAPPAIMASRRPLVDLDGLVGDEDVAEWRDIRRRLVEMAALCVRDVEEIDRLLRR